MIRNTTIICEAMYIASHIIVVFRIMLFY